MINDNELENGPRSELRGLINFCQQDLEQTLPAVASILRKNDTDEPDIEGARNFINQLPPLVTLPINDIKEFTGINFDLIRPDNSLRTPYAQGWMRIRRGEAGNEALEDLKTKLVTESANYVAQVVKAYRRTREDGFDGFVDFLDKAGMTEGRLIGLLDSIKSIKENHYPKITEAADIRRQDWPEVSPLMILDEMDQALAQYNHEGIKRVILDWKNPPVPSAFLFATITNDGLAQLKGFVVEIPGESEAKKTHEKAHVFMACKLFEQGKIPTAVAGVGVQEKFARIIEGVDTGEALFFASCIDASYKFAQFADRVCSQSMIEGETEEEYNKRIEKELKDTIDNSVLIENSDTGLKSVPGSEVIPFGPRTVPYMLDVVEAVSLRGELQKQGLHDPNQIFDVVTEA